MLPNPPAGGNAAPAPPPVPPFHRWHCPRCAVSYRHPWHLAAHLQRPSLLGLPHELSEADAWLTVGTVLPVDTTPGLARYPECPPIRMAAPPVADDGKAVPNV